jgi:hypothetical protein
LGHHIHQIWKLKLKGVASTRKIEQEYFKKRGALKKSSPSVYGKLDKVEWFAETFSLFWMCRRDLVASRFLKIMTEVLNVG